MPYIYDKLLAMKVIRRQRMLDTLNVTTAPVLTPSESAAPGVIAKKPSYPRRKKQRKAGLYVHPLPHGDYRNVARASKKNEGGFTIFNGHQVQHESFLEHRVSCMFQADPHVADLFSQRPRVDFLDAEGVWCYTVFDFLVIKKDGTYVGVAVKPEAYRESMEAMFERIAETSDQTEIHTAEFVSDEQATLKKYGNALDILWSREFAKDLEIDRVVEMLTGRETVQFWELYDRNFLGNYQRKAAVWSLIDFGILTPVDEHERVNDLSHLKINL